MTMSTVTVTGGTGYLASWIVRDLLKEGHDVRITVRNKDKVEKYQYLVEFEKEYKGSLSVFEADLLQEGSFDEAVQGAEVVIHTASPFLISSDNPEKDLIQPAKQGTKNVLTSVEKAPTVKRVVLTSSIVAIMGDNKEMAGREAFTENDWNTTSTSDHQPYPYSKTLAEQEAWKMVKNQNQYDLVTINPSFIMGPTLSGRSDSTSISTIQQFLTGGFKTGVPKLYSGIVDVRDVAKAHILAAFKPEAHGRYIVSSGEVTFLEIAKIIEKNFPGKYPLPKREVPKALIWLIAPSVGLTRKYVKENAGYRIAFDTTKSKQELGMTYRAIEATFVDQVDQMEEDGLVK
ncbi:diaminohydroxyphosphoribosylaminopyrimidine deaminase [Bacillus coahuilensis m2-6]|nr:diaminohydroxyphosphoribosylaminopyrimidine deaminase [Bacillus coahuilensis m2-6]